MANLVPQNEWSDVRQLEKTDVAIAGAGGTMNQQAQALLNRTAVLRNASGIIDASGKTQQEVNDENQISSYIFTPSSLSDNTIEIQSAIDYCATNSLNCKPVGEFKISSKVVIKGEFDGSRATFTTIAETPIAVEVSTGDGDNPTTILSLTESERIILPNIVNGTKPITGWDNQGIGIRYVNVQNTQITERLVQDFAIGIQHTAYAQGCGYNTVTAGYLRNNKVNRQFIVGDIGGWTNRWDLHGGRYFHSSAEGQNVTGCMHFDVVPNATGNIINDINHFGGSFEGLSEQYHIRLGGSYINFYGIRFENRDTTGGIKVHLASAGLVGQGSANSFVYGRGVNADDGVTADRLRITKDAGVGNARIAVISSNSTSYVSAAGVVEVKKSTSSAADFIYCGVDATFEYSENVSTNYSFGISASALHGKRKTDTNDRIKLDFVNGRTYYGLGTSSPNFYIGQQGSSSLSTNSNWIPQASAIYTLGATGFAWDRLFLAKGFGAFGAAPLLTQPTITGKKTPATIAEQNAVLDSIVAALAVYGLVGDDRTA